MRSVWNISMLLNNTDFAIKMHVILYYQDISKIFSRFSIPSSIGLRLRSQMTRDMANVDLLGRVYLKSMCDV